MPLQGTITTPAGNVLGTYGVVTQVGLICHAENPTALNVVGCTLLLYASQASYQAGAPAVAVYRYSLGNAAVQPNENFITAAELIVIKTQPTGMFTTADAAQPATRSTWTPGWTGSTQVPPVAVPPAGTV